LDISSSGKDLPESIDALLRFSFPNEFLTWHFARPYQQEVRRRTWMVRIFPNQASFQRLTTALTMEQSENWLTNHRYMDLQVSEEEPLEIHSNVLISAQVLAT
jgi:transposase-like protein